MQITGALVKPPEYIKDFANFELGEARLCSTINRNFSESFENAVQLSFGGIIISPHAKV